MLTDFADQIAAAVEGYFWPKIFWDFLTKTLDPAVKPIPILQTINLISGIVLLAWEWPLSFLAGSSFHRSLEARLAVLPLTALSAALMYQATNAAIYQVIGLGVYFWAYSEGEVCLASRLARLENDTDCDDLDDLREALDFAATGTARTCLVGDCTKEFPPCAYTHGVNTRCRPKSSFPFTLTVSPLVGPPSRDAS
jgi:hypothetical protein